MSLQCKYCSQTFAHGPARSSHERAHEVRNNFTTDIRFTRRPPRATTAAATNDVPAQAPAPDATAASTPRPAAVGDRPGGARKRASGDIAGGSPPKKRNPGYSVKIMEGVYYGLPTSLPHDPPKRIESLVEITKLSFGIDKRPISRRTLRDGHKMVFDSELGKCGQWVLSTPVGISKGGNVPQTVQRTYGSSYGAYGTGGVGNIRSTYPRNRAQQRDQQRMFPGIGKELLGATWGIPAEPIRSVPAPGQLADGSDSTERILWNLATLLEEYEHMKEEDEERWKKKMEEPLRQIRNL
ncbi:hypothetical protein CERZMDRAFT_94115 [Cercospora zeae-maydis SCOH1-5]|uniref:C2H2-type domain-containing protein n=1 Tax=Cercospora zeae-maydis SCOH1-5 TaxID=717836 RepID=A0A6A6FRB3_9PEZI|nr:hypothetical protein CERZMDRAFT_94115 [Cercospora zeae-maydis SCOH1-5]